VAEVEEEQVGEVDKEAAVQRRDVVLAEIEHEEVACIVELTGNLR